MILTVYRLNKNRETFKYLSDAQKMHLLITDLFNNSRKDVNALYRVEYKNGDAYLFIQSDIKPGPFEGGHIIKQREIDDLLLKSDHFIISIITAPSKHYTINGRKSLHYIKTEEERKGWIKKKLYENGIHTEFITEHRRDDTYFRHSKEKGGSAVISSWEYTCEIEVADEDKMLNLWRKGLGHHKAYGQGLILLKGVF